MYNNIIYIYIYIYTKNVGEKHERKRSRIPAVDANNTVPQCRRWVKPLQMLELTRPLEGPVALSIFVFVTHCGTIVAPLGHFKGL